MLVKPTTSTAGVSKIPVGAGASEGESEFDNPLKAYSGAGGADAGMCQRGLNAPSSAAEV